MDKGSAAWNELSAEERAAHEEEAGVFRDVEDKLVLQPRGRDQLAFCVHHIGRYLHECHYSGVATRTKPNVFVYRETYTNYDDKQVECAVKLSRDANKIVFEEEDWTAADHDCRMYCGAHASLNDGMEFALADAHLDPAEISEAQDERGGCPLPK